MSMNPDYMDHHYYPAAVADGSWRALCFDCRLPLSTLRAVPADGFKAVGTCPRCGRKWIDLTKKENGHGGEGVSTGEEARGDL